MGNITDMAVYTHLTHDEVAEFIARYDIGVLDAFEGITEGVSNTNYLVTTDRCRTILTLFERNTNIEDLPYFIALMKWWSGKGISCPQPIAMQDGRMLSALKERPALLVSFLEGSGASKISIEHVAQLGRLLAEMHVAGMGFPHERANGLSLPAWEKMIDANHDRFDDIAPGLQKIISEEYNYLSEHWPSTLPTGPVHADLFPDNVFFEKSFGKKPVLSGVIDFYYACNDMWAYDLAIAVNAWCFDDRHRLVPERVQVMMAAYNDMRPMTPEEDRAMPILLRGAALRFLLTRSRDRLNPQAGATITPKDPLEYLAKLQFFQQQDGA